MSSGEEPAIEEAFLVHKSGCLIEFVTVEESIEVDYDVTIGMLTAIQSFVKDIFGEGRWSLKKLEFENKNIMIELAENFYLAVVYTGKATAKMSHNVEKSLSLIEEKYGHIGENWNGDMDAWAGAKDMIRTIFLEDEDSPVFDEDLQCPLCGALVDENATKCGMCEFDFSLMGN